ncbi:beta-lactamase regulating signal transducer with metallopeptidase domain [Natranaerovirga hydrolytica]|uniref:Beta-lactamase regulating signal transducer with metallopeptidase domain n=2 Tax=Natranaerovirga hydrolytica TaxID=680378 RepID=A0A4R1N295_9FIRM|nr:beta-lactamase regulating signal transducer with metallopeptidase domain [Natranaerovirga hydrolytica]
MIFSPSSFITVVFLCSLLITFIWFYLRDIDRMVQLGIKSIFAFIAIVAIRLVFPFEFSFSNTFASRYIMPNLMDILNTPAMNAFNKTFTILHVLFFVWVVGIIIAATATLKTFLQFGKIVKQLPILRDSKLENILHTITQDYKKPVSFQVIHSNLISAPMLYGFRSPKIIVPTMNLTYTEWYFILKHEIAHYYNRDLQIKLFVQVLRIIYWWNPFVYLFNNEIDKMLEIRADLEVTTNLSEDEKTKYLDCLLKVAKNLSLERHNYYSVAFGNGKTSTLSQRFHLILGGYKRSKNKWLMTIVVTISLVILLCFSFIAVFEPYAIHPHHAANTFELKEDSSYLLINPNGGYDLYINHNFVATAQEIKDSYSNLKIYNDVEEAKNHEDKK